MKEPKFFARSNKGFTLIELIVVIVILGVLAATAMPKFINMQRAARIAAVEGFAGGLRSAVVLAQGAYEAQDRVGSSITTGDNSVIDVYTTANATRIHAPGTPLTGPTGMPRLMNCMATGEPPVTILVPFNAYNCNGMHGYIANNNTTNTYFIPEGLAPATALNGGLVGSTSCFVVYRANSTAPNTLIEAATAGC